MLYRDRKDAALPGAHAANARVSEPRMTGNVDILSPRAAEVAEELRGHLAPLFRIAVGVGKIDRGKGFPIHQVRKPKNRRLVDVRPKWSLPETRAVGNVLVVEPGELIAQKVLALESREGSPKWGTDGRDLAHLLLTFPELKSARGAVRDRREAGQMRWISPAGSAPPESSCEIRVWAGFGSEGCPVGGHPLEGIVLRKDGDRFSGARHPRAPTKTDIAPPSGWPEFWRDMEGSGAPDLPDSSEIKESKDGLDGISCVVEFRRGDAYRNLMYREPALQDAPEAKQLLRLLEISRREAKFRSEP